MTLMYRGQINDQHFFERMKRYGLNVIEASRELRAAAELPGVQDMVRFVVKEGFSPELIEDLTQGEPVPERFVTELERRGLSSFWAEVYWRTHYDEMSRGDAEEAFHRLNPTALEHKTATLERLGFTKDQIVFDEEFLTRIYKLNDIFPGLRPRMLMLSYKPIARIDVRRLEDFDFLPDEELEFRNQEIGYSPEDSKLLSTWVRINNTLKDVIPQLRRVEINFDQAMALLVEAGATVELATKIINRKKPAIKKERVAKEKDITKVQFEDGFEFGMLDRDEYKDGLLGLNYDEDEAEYLISLTEFKMDMKVKKKKATEKNLTKSDILTQFELKLINESDTEEKLVSIGFDETEAKELIEIRKTKLERKSKK